MQDFLNHSGTSMLPARPRKSHDKRSVKFGARIVERGILTRLCPYRYYRLDERDKAAAEVIC